MDPVPASALLKLALPLAGVALVLVVARARGMSWREDLGLRAPGTRPLLGWLALWLAWIAAGELVIEAFGLDQASPWPDDPPLVVALRVLAIGLAGPLVEEFVMRGILLARLRRTRLGATGAVIVVAAAWSVMHWRYGAGTLVMIFADGLLLGAARVRGGSLWLPVSMHAVGNLVSIAQSLGA